MATETIQSIYSDIEQPLRIAINMLSRNEGTAQAKIAEELKLVLERFANAADMESSQESSLPDQLFNKTFW